MTTFVNNGLLDKAALGRRLSIEPKRSDQWVQSLLKKEQATIELICFPFAGGGISTYQSWGRLLSSNINLSAVLLPGREIRIQQAPESDMDKVCDSIINEILTRYSQKRLVFFGHSMGSILAYEVARRLQQDHKVFLKAFIASGHQAPHLYFGGHFHCASDDDFIQELKRFGQTPDIIFEDAEMRSLFLPMLRADYALFENYQLETPVELHCPLLTCTGKMDSEVTPKQIQSWQDLTSVKAQHQILPGDHFYLMDTVSRDQLINIINDHCMLVTVC